MPIGLASFANDFRPIRKFAERDFTNIVSWSEFDRGGHWAAHDAPDLLVGDIRQFFRRSADDQLGGDAPRKRPDVRESAAGVAGEPTAPSR